MPYNDQIREDGQLVYLPGFGWVKISNDPDVGEVIEDEDMYVSGEQCSNAEW